MRQGSAALLIAVHHVELAATIRAVVVRRHASLLLGHHGATGRLGSDRLTVGGLLLLPRGSRMRPHISALGLTDVLVLSRHSMFAARDNVKVVELEG